MVDRRAQRLDAMRERGDVRRRRARLPQVLPDVLAVPLAKSAEHDQGRLAEGYALLLAHIEKQDGFVHEALTRLNPQFGARPNQGYPLGQGSPLMVAEGRLYKTYPEFVREVIVNARARSPGAWVQGGIVDGDDETRLLHAAGAAGQHPGETRRR